MDHKDYYQTLGVDKNASADDIKKAYRKLVRKHHPDVSRARDADHRTKEINEAYGVLGDPGKRAGYDAEQAAVQAQDLFRARQGRGSAQSFGSHAFSPHDTGGAPFGDDDFFSDLFAHVGRRRSGTGASRGADLHATITVSLEDVYRGATRTVSLPTGAAERRVSVTIAQGTLPGEQIRMVGEGRPGMNGGPPGDLLLEVQLRHHARFEVDGRDVHARLPVAPWEAALGAVIDVATPSGQVSVTVPPNSQNGRKLRLKGRGIPAHPPGNLYLSLEIVLPPANTAREKAVYQYMARELPFNARTQA